MQTKDKQTQQFLDDHERRLVRLRRLQKERSLMLMPSPIDKSDAIRVLDDEIAYLFKATNICIPFIELFGISVYREFTTASGFTWFNRNTIVRPIPHNLIPDGVWLEQNIAPESVYAFTTVAQTKEYVYHFKRYVFSGGRDYQFAANHETNTILYLV